MAELNSVISFLCVSLLLGVALYSILQIFGSDSLDKMPEQKSGTLSDSVLQIILPLTASMFLALANYRNGSLSLGDLAFCLAGAYCFFWLTMFKSFKQNIAITIQSIPLVIMILYIIFRTDFLLWTALIVVVLDMVIKYLIIFCLIKLFGAFCNK